MKAVSSTDTCVDGNVNTTTDRITITNHKLKRDQAVVLSTAGVLPTGLSARTYYVIFIDINTIQLATSTANSRAGTAVDITAAAGGGTHTLTFSGELLRQITDGNLKKLIQGSTLMEMKVVPGTGSVIPDTTINLDIEDRDNSNLWSKTAMSKDAESRHKLWEDIGTFLPVMDKLYLVLNDIGTAGDQVTLHFMAWISSP